MSEAEFVISSDRIIVPAGVVGLQRDVNFFRERPAWLKHVRIYEIAPDLAPDVRTVVLDALGIPRLDAVDDIIRNEGCVGAWRPSTIIVDRIHNFYTDVCLADHVIAHSLWNVDLHSPAQRGCAFGLTLSNNDREDQRDRTIMAMLTFVEMSDDDLGLPPGDPRRRTPVRSGQERALLRRIEQLERTVQDLQRKIT